METGFLSSSSTRTTEVIPLIKSKLFFTHSRKISFHHNYKLGTSSSLTCCQLGSSWSNEDGMKPTITEDWRSFRAKLVAAERISRPQDPSQSSSLPHDVDPPRLTINDKWAHPIHKPEKGCLLIATEKLDGVHIFERTVILLLSTGPGGPTGIILNRPSLMSIKEIKSTVLDLSGMFSGRPLFFGGPLDEGLFLVTSQNDKDDDVVGKSGVFDEVMKGLYYGCKESVGCAAEMVKRKMVGLDNLRFFDGYCGWEKEQLNEEIRAGYWALAACSPTCIELETANSGEMWEEILGLMGPRKVW